MRRLLAAALVGATALTALADPVLERVDSELTGNRRLTVTVEAVLEGRGELRVEGEVNGRKFKKRKRVRRAGTARLRVNVDARKLRVRKLDGPLEFSLQAIAAERDGGSTTRPVERRVPVPVVFLPGLGNETAPDVASGVFAAAVDLAAGGIYDTGGDAPTFVVHGYDSLGESLSSSARGLQKRVRRVLRGTPFARVDVVGYSMGGLVARRWAADGGKARRMVFLGTPNEGAPLAQLLGIGLQSDLLGSGLIPGLEGLGDLTGLLDALAGPDAATDVLRTFYPTYPWLFVTLDIPFFGGRVPVTQELIQNFGSFVPGLGGLQIDLSSPLTPLNAVGPDSATAYHALGYSALLTDQLGIEIGTVDEVDVTALLGGGEIDPATLATGEGDGLVPWRSLVMADTPVWAAVLESTDLGTGTHVTLLADPACIMRVAEILTE